MTEIQKSIKFIVAMRTARAAIGWNQQEFADLMGVAKSTIARIETLEIVPKADFLMQAIELFGRFGISINLFNADGIPVIINDKAIEIAQAKLLDDTQRRADRKGEPLMVERLHKFKNKKSDDDK